MVCRKQIFKINSETKKINLLEVTPMREELVLTTYTEKDLVVLSFPRFRNRWIQKYLLPKSISSHFTIELEEYGTSIWNLIDGINNVSDIVQQMIASNLNEPQMEDRVLTYIRQLHKDKFIRFFIQK